MARRSTIRFYLTDFVGNFTKYQVKKELGAYLHTVPTYVYPCVGELLRYIGLEQLTKQIISKQKEERIHRNPFKTIQAMRGIAIAGNVRTYIHMLTYRHTHTLFSLSTCVCFIKYFYLKVLVIVYSNLFFFNCMYLYLTSYVL